MNKQELIKKYNNECFATISTDEVLEDLKQLDEPQKVVVPQFVADWIEECKNDDFHLFGAMEAISLNQKKLDYWFREDDNMELFARAWLDGYEVEKEKRYRISMPKARNYKNHAQILCEEDGKMFWCGEWYRFKTKFTRKELEEDGFGWVFDCEGIEVKEVVE